MLLLVAGCSSGDYSGGPSPAPTATATTATTAPVTTLTTVAGEVVVRGAVAQVLASARVVVLARPVAGFTTIAFTADTEVVRANGAKATIADVTPGADIEATGRAGTAGALLARRVVLP